MMFKHYRRVAGILEYREAWDTDDGIIEHWGVCGTVGETRQHVLVDRSDRARFFADLMTRAKKDGYRPIPEDQHQGM